MEFLELAKERFSCRKMSDKKVDDALVDKIIEAGILAPTAVNKQAFKIWNIKSEKAKEAIRNSTRFDFSADTFLVVGCKADEAWTRKYDSHNFYEVDGAIVATHMMMEITDLGLYTTWVGHFNAPKLQELCPEMKDYLLIAIFPIGYAQEDDEEAKPNPRHFERKTREELVETL